MSDSESKIIDVSMSEMKTASNDYILRSSGIGSCVVITLYDSQKRVGAMAHPMLALPAIIDNKQLTSQMSKVKGQRSNVSLRFVESAIDAMLSALIGLGASKERLEAKIVGGASMFKVFDKNPESIGAHNVEAAVKKLKKEGIKIIATDTGENCGRSVAFDLATGVVEVKTKI